MITRFLVIVPAGACLALATRSTRDNARMEGRAPDLRERLAAIGAFRAELESPGFDAGRWHASHPTVDDPDVWTMPWFELSDRAEAFVAALAGIMISDFDWPSWMGMPEGQALSSDHAAVAAADPTQLAKLATAVIRSDRFNEGAIASCFESGLMTAIAERAEALARE